MEKTALALSDVTLTLKGNAGAVDILKGINLTVKEGETLALIGPSGSGKSSLLMLIGGLERASGGSVTALGQDLGVMNEDQLARFRRDNMGVVFQSFHLVPTMTALENVALPLELAGVKDAFARAQAELETVGLGARLNHYPRQMSGGEQQRVALARAAAPHPRILLADEPTGNLDGANGAAIMELLFALRDRYGSTLVLVTHAPELAARCDRVVRLADGRVEDGHSDSGFVGVEGERADDARLEGVGADDTLADEGAQLGEKRADDDAKARAGAHKTAPAGAKK